MVAVVMSVSVLLALRESTVKVVHTLSLLHIIFLNVISNRIHIHFQSWLSYVPYYGPMVYIFYALSPLSSALSCIWEILYLVFYSLFGWLDFYFPLFAPSVEILACDSNPCQNGATCFDHNGGGGYVCLCPAGYEGTSCENGIFSYFSILFICWKVVIYIYGYADCP